MSKPLTVSFPLPKDSIRKLVFSDPAHVVYHVYPRLSHYRGKSIPDKNNPRPHDETVLTSSVSRKIWDTLERKPKSFKSRNRGALVVAEAARYDDEKGEFTIILRDHELRRLNDGSILRPMHGLADGGTTDETIAAFQKAKSDCQELHDAQFHLEVVVFADNEGEELRDYVLEMCEARNTSKQVTPWTIADLRGEWNWLRQQLENHWPGKVAYHEFEIANTETTILDVIAILNLFHPYYSENKVPTSSYSSKGSMFKVYEAREAGFKALGPVVSDILELHDFVYANFNAAHKTEGSKKSLRRYKDGVEGTKLFREFTPPKPMIFGQYTAELEVDRGLLYPVVSAFRALLDSNGTARWFMDPKQFWTDHGPKVMEQLMDALDGHRKNPQSVGKDPNVYRLLYGTVRSIRMDEELKRLRAKLAK